MKKKRGDSPRGFGVTKEGGDRSEVVKKWSRKEKEVLCSIKGRRW